MTAKPIPKKIKRLRQRKRRDGTWRIWWEPETAIVDLGFSVFELDENKLGWSVRKCEQLNLDVTRARAAGGKVAPTGGRTMAALIGEYRRSHKFLLLADKTRQDYNTRLNAIDLKWGGQMVASFTKPVMFTWYETMHENSGAHQALQMIRMISALFSYAELKGWRAEESNPCFKLKMHVPKGRSRSATWSEFDALIKRADARAATGDHNMAVMACGIVLSMLHAARQTDVRLARMDGFRNMRVAGLDGPTHEFIWEMRRSKRQNLGMMPVHPEADARIRRVMAQGDAGREYLLVNPANDKPYNEERFGQIFADLRADVAASMPTIKTLQFRDLRRTFATMARAGGSTKDDVGDVLGNSAATDPQLGEIYMPSQFATAKRAVAAVRRPETEEGKTG